MSDGNALLRAICSHQDEDTPALMLADWLQENGAVELAVALRGAVAAKPGRTLYLVTSGSYSDYSVVGVFSSKGNAEKFMAASDGESRWTDFNDLEEYTLDHGVAAIERGLLPFRVRMLRDGNEAVAQRQQADALENDTGRFQEKYSFERPEPAFVADVWARDGQHAIKVANEKRIALLAQPATA